MAFKVDCPKCKMQLLGLDTYDGKALSIGIDAEPETFACPICEWYPLVVDEITEEEYSTQREALADEKGTKMFVSRVSHFPCGRCQGDTERRLFGYWRRCRVCGKWTKTKDIQWEIGGVRFKCASCGRFYFLSRQTLDEAERWGGKVIPYCSKCVPPDDFKNMEDITTEVIG